MCMIIFQLKELRTQLNKKNFSVADGLFVSNYTGKTPFAAVNLIMPVIMIMGTVGLMIITSIFLITNKKKYHY